MISEQQSEFRQGIFKMKENEISFFRYAINIKSVDASPNIYTKKVLYTSFQPKNIAQDSMTFKLAKAFNSEHTTSGTQGHASLKYKQKNANLISFFYPKR